MPELQGNKQYKAFFFDLDNTLAKLGKPAKPSTVNLLHRLEEKGRIILSSGKPLYYLCGYARQLGLSSPFLMGENGSLAQIGVDLPPKTVLKASYPKEADIELSLLRKSIESKFPDIWFQPNEICLTPFPTKQEEWDAIQALADSIKGKSIQVVRHNDSFDFMPLGIDKGVGVNLLANYFGWKKEEIVGFGDADNDIPLIKACGLSFGLGEVVRPFSTFYAKNIDMAIKRLLSLMN